MAIFERFSSSWQPERFKSFSQLRHSLQAPGLFPMRIGLHPPPKAQSDGMGQMLGIPILAKPSIKMGIAIPIAPATMEPSEQKC